MSKTAIYSAFGMASGLAIALSASPALAQDAVPDTEEVRESVGQEPSEEDSTIVVQARRRGESQQDVPLVVNAVTAETIEDLEITDFTDVASVVPGLVLARDPIANSATLRGVNFNAFASGNNATVEFYLNETAIAAQVLFPTLYDVGQIEVLRGPQGTLRGRAAPSGSITVTTRRPNLFEAGGFADGSISSIGGDNPFNGRAAINVPIVEGVLGIRVAGSIEDSAGTRVRSINNSLDPFNRTQSGRVSALFEPTDNISINAMYQTTQNRLRNFTRVESANILNPALPASPVFIGTFDNRAVENDTEIARQKYASATVGGEWRFAGQKLNYVGARHTLTNGIESNAVAGAQTGAGGDPGNFFNSAFRQPGLQSFAQTLYSRQRQTNHELRLSSDERLFGMLDYVVGVFQQKTNSPSDFINRSIILFGPASPSVGVLVVQTPIARRGTSTERSAFGNLTVHLGQGTEVSGGLRFIKYDVESSLIVSGVRNPFADEDESFDATIYSASVKHRFNENLMAYASFGTSWRPGLNVVGDFSIARTPRENSFLIIPPETSKSIEAGIKTNFFDNRLTFNATAFHQTFENYPYRGPAVQYVLVEAPVAGSPPGSPNRQSVSNFNFVAPVPVKVTGVEVEANFRASENFRIGGNFAYAKGTLEGTIPCNDYNPRDGIPDAVTLPFTDPAVIRNATGGDSLSVCDVERSSAQSPEWSATLNSEFSQPYSDRLEAFLRGQASIYGENDGDPSSPFDNVDSHAIVNLFSGLRDPEGGWELTAFVKNLFDKRLILSRGGNPLQTSFRIGATPSAGVTTYRSVSVNDPREVGISLRVAFGSR